MAGRVSDASRGRFNAPRRSPGTPGHFITSIRKFLNDTTKKRSVRTGDGEISGAVPVASGGESRRDIRALISLKMTQCWYPGGWDGKVGGGA